MLQTLHRHGSLGKPVFGMKLGTVGFLMNRFDIEDLPRRLSQAKRSTIHPLLMLARDRNGREERALADGFLPAAPVGRGCTWCDHMITL